ncbi:MAG: thioredoxin family protein [Sphingomonadales bacterium]|nr:thioredoxin family protein [Sphingomonadales bacterium]NCT05005.1 thioredoxin family protein [Sphingomonadales bacterium]
MSVNRFLALSTAFAAVLALAACESEASSPQAQSQLSDAGETAEIPVAEWIDYDPATFARAQQDGETILVDVNATWCPTCKAQAPILDDMRDDPEMGDVVFMKLDFDTQKGFLEEHRIPRQSTIVVFQGEQETARSIAETDPERLRSAIIAGV